LRGSLHVPALCFSVAHLVSPHDELYRIQLTAVVLLARGTSHASCLSIQKKNFKKKCQGIETPQVKV